MHAFEQARAAYETAQRHYNDCEGRYFDRKPKAPEARLRRLKRATDVAAAEAAHHAALDRVADVTAAMLSVTAHSLSGLAVKARIVKHWGKPDWWEDDGDTYERLAAQIIDAVIATDA